MHGAAAMHLRSRPGQCSDGGHGCGDDEGAGAGGDQAHEGQVGPALPVGVALRLGLFCWTMGGHGGRLMVMVMNDDK